ncbi:MAG: SCO1664 family protein [Sporichthyaceae bacterium]
MSEAFDESEHVGGRPELTEAVVTEILRRGELTIVGRMVDASNATLYCQASLDGETVTCVHKPIAGERPLWDFPDGTLAAREVAAYEVSAATGWGIVPATVLREGPWGQGMCQRWIDADTDVDVARMVRTKDERLRPIAVLDAVINNADRKGGHLLITADGGIRGIDHGVSFALDYKLRTLLWGWAGQDLPPDALEVLARLERDWERGLGPVLAGLLTPRETGATRRRIRALLASGRHPEPPDNGWPAVPWPPF